MDSVTLTSEAGSKKLLTQTPKIAITCLLIKIVKAGNLKIAGA